MKLRIVVLSSALACFAASAIAPTAHAQEAASDERARIHFQSGRAYYENGDYESALRDFRAAYELSHRDALLYNIYLSEERVGEFGAAARTLEAYLQSDAVAEADRPQLEARLVHLRERAAEEARREEARAQAQAQAQAERARERERTRDGGQQDDDRGDGARSSPDDRASGGGGPPLPALVAWGVGAAGLVTFGLFGALALAEDGRLATDCGADVGRTCDDDALGTLHTYAALADVGWIVALAGGITGTLFFLLGGGDDDGERPSATASAWVRDDGAGLVLSGRL